MKEEIIQFANRSAFQLKKYSPEILLGLGIVGTVASTVLACKATTKVNDILEKKKMNINAVHDCLNDETIDYTEEDSKKDLTIIYAQTGVNLVKLYAPSVALGILSMGCIISGHKILKGRNIALAAAYAAVDTGFKKYRKNVVERFGKDVDHELRYNIKAKEIEETTIDENGKKKTEKKVVYEMENPLDHSEYARFFDAGSADHKKDPEYNMMFLRRQQDYANEMLKARGHLFLNEVYDLLDIPRSKAGQVVGWIYPKRDANGNYPKDCGDGYVDFGLYSGDEANRRFVNGYEYNILLDFNVDGPIYDKI